MNSSIKLTKILSNIKVRKSVRKLKNKLNLSSEKLISNSD
jgi:hypothetical protein